MRIGQVLVQRCIIEPQELADALTAQAQRPDDRLGDIIVELQFATRDDVETAASVVERQRLDVPTIGEILLDAGLVTEEDIEAALAKQRIRGGLLGQRLVDDGAVTREQLMDALRLQAETFEALRHAGLVALPGG